MGTPGDKALPVEKVAQRLAACREELAAQQEIAERERAEAALHEISRQKVTRTGKKVFRDLDELQRLYDELEVRVQKRTVELAQANKELQAKVAERKRAEEVLQESEERFRALFETMIEGVALHQVIYDESGAPVDYVVLSVNPAYKSHTGIDSEDAVGKKASEFYGTGKPPYFDIYERVAHTGETAHFETYFEPLDRHLSISVFSPGKGQFATVFEDITARVRAEEAQRRYADEQAALYAVTSAAAASLDPDALLSATLDAVLPVLGSSAGWVTLPGPTLDDPPRIAAWRNVPDEFLAAEASLPLRDCPVCAPLLAGDEVQIDPTLCAECSRLPFEVLDGAGLHSHVGIPLAAGDRVLGILNVAWRAPSPYTEADCALLTAIGQQVGLALRNAQLYQAARQVDRLRALNELDQALAATLDPDTVVEITLRQIAAAVDAPMGSLFVLPPPREGQADAYPEQIFILSRGWVEMATSEEDARRLQTFLPCFRESHEPVPLSGDELVMLSGGEYPGLAERWGPHGIMIPVFSNKVLVAILALGGRPAERPFTDEDRALALSAAARASQAIQNARQHQVVMEAEARYRSLYHGVPVGLYRTTPEGQFLVVNRALAQVLGYPDLDTLLAANADDLYADTGERRQWQTLMEREGEVHDFETRFRRHDGGVIWMQDNARTVRDESGQVVYYEGSLVDVTARKQAEETLWKSEASLSEAQRIAHLGNWGWDIVTNELWRSDEACRILGLPPREFERTRDASLKSVHLEDREFVKHSINQALYEDKPYSIDHRVVLPDGSERIVHEQGEVTCDESGRPVRMVGTVQDVTEQMQAEKALRQSEARLIEAQRIAHLGNWDWDIVTNELWWSDEVSHIFGLTSQEFGATYDTFLAPVHPDDRELVGRTVDQALYEDQPYNIAHRIVLPDGAERIVHTQAEVTCDESGQPVRMVGTVQDITARVRLEERLAAIYQLGRELTLLHDEETILRRVLETAAGVFQFDSLCYGLVDEEAGELVRHCRLVNGVLERVELHMPLDGEQGIGVAVVQGGQAINVPDTAQNPRYLSLPGEQFRSILCVPIKVGERIIGVLNTKSARPNHFAPADEQLLQTLADQTAVALENARLYRASQERAARLDVLNVISAAVASSLDTNTVLRQILGQTCRALDAERGSILWLEEKTGELVFAPTLEDEETLLGGHRLPPGQGIAGWVAQHDQAVCVNDVRQDPRYYDGISQITSVEIHSLLGAPLRCRGKVIGVIEIINKREGEFSDEDLGLLEAVSSVAAVALENARLYTATRARADELALLNEIGLAVTSTLDYDKVVRVALSQTQRLFQADGVSLLQPDSQTGELYFARVISETGPIEIPVRLQPGEGIAGWVLEQRQAVLVEDAQTDPRWSDRVDRSLDSQTRALMAIPLLAQGRAIGVIEAVSSEPGAYTDDELHILQTLASTLAVALENARLFEQIRTGHEQLQALSRRLVEVQEAERAHIARELHDETGQTLASLLLGLSLLEREVDDPVAVIIRVNELESMVDGMLENLHRLAMNLRPATLDHLGLVPALEHHIESFGQRHGITTQFEMVGLKDERLPPAIETAIYRIVQEALTNVVRHAQASHVDMLLERRGGRIITIVEDDGVGFDPETVTQNYRLGLFGMRERAEMLNGTLVIESGAGTGTTVLVEIPHVHPDREA